MFQPLSTIGAALTKKRKKGNRVKTLRLGPYYDLGPLVETFFLFLSSRDVSSCDFGQTFNIQMAQVLFSDGFSTITGKLYDTNINDIEKNHCSEER